MTLIKNECYCMVTQICHWLGTCNFLFKGDVHHKLFWNMSSTQVFDSFEKKLMCYYMEEWNCSWYWDCSKSPKETFQVSKELKKKLLLFWDYKLWNDFYILHITTIETGYKYERLPVFLLFVDINMDMVMESHVLVN